jgi:hypothetical protein
VMRSKVPDRYERALHGPVLTAKKGEVSVDVLPRNFGKLTHACRGEESQRVPYHVPSVSRGISREAPSRQLLSVLFKLMLPHRR